MKPLKRIAITGPESTGKTWLAQHLASHYQTVYVPEYAVEYLKKNGPDYNQEDIVNIAKGQLKQENELVEKSKRLLFCDTDLMVTKIWSKVVFGSVPRWIEQKVKEHQYDLYLLCYPDIEWEYAPFRQNPDDRDYLFGLYEEEMQKQHFNYRIIKGHGNQRLKNAINFVDELI